MKQKTQKKPVLGMAILTGVVLVAGAVAWFSLGGTDEPAPASALTAQSETPVPNMRTRLQTLNPVLFTGKAREAYQAAEEHPDLLQQLPCFCGCMAGGHKHNLDCFKDYHGVTCPMCQSIALEGKQMLREGRSIAQIRQAIEIKYSAQPPEH